MSGHLAEGHGVIPFDLGAALPAASVPLLHAMEALFGFVPNLGSAMAASPSALGGYLGSLRALESGDGLTPIERQLVMIAASRANEAAYGVAVHSAFARKLGASEAIIAAATDENVTSGDTRVMALIRFATVLTRDRGQVEERELRAIVDQGFGPASLVEIAFAIALKHFANTIAHLAKPEIDAGFSSAADIHGGKEAAT
jgi:uncharacterized peroxidase-related enzyme